MNFELDKNQVDIKKKFAEICKKEIAAASVEIDETESFPRKNLDILSESGFLSAPLNDSGFDYITSVAIGEDLAAACASTAICVTSGIWIPYLVISNFGSADAKSKWLDKLISGKAIGSYSISDPDGGHLSDVKVKADKDGSGVKINGKKAPVVNGAAADLSIVIARNEDGSLVAFVAEKGMSGFSAGKRIRTMGLRGAQVAELSFENCVIAKENILGSGNDGEEIASFMVRIARLFTSILAVGISAASYAAAKNRAETRISGGKPIGAYQEISFRIADIYIETDTTR
ncbi:MAG TPA: acyl-CoA dehydrogenase family protein, partial [bacterium]|nr:acyl-CoA dehydrogenase family protein [bacterium]